jgi:hypothetical protein
MPPRPCARAPDVATIQQTKANNNILDMALRLLVITGSLMMICGPVVGPLRLHIFNAQVLERNERTKANENS